MRQERKRTRRGIFLLQLLVVIGCFAISEDVFSQDGRDYQSTICNSDGTVTFQYWNPSAKKVEGLDLSFALDQIAGRQKARVKLPSWFALADKLWGEGKTLDEAHFLVFPPHISMEQCSSEQTARYKKSVLDRILSSILDHPCSRNTHFIDITGGFGVDFSFLAQGFAEATYVERQEHLCEIARHNFPLLGLPKANVVCKELETPLELPFLGNGLGTDLKRRRSEGEVDQKETVVFIDPARRDTNGNRTYAIGDCTPNILDFIGELLKRTAVVMVKLSPMLDWHQTVEDINRASGSGNAVREVHIVSTQNECKELLLVLSERYESEMHVCNESWLFFRSGKPFWNKADCT